LAFASTIDDAIPFGSHIHKQTITHSTTPNILSATQIIVTAANPFDKKQQQKLKS
jgi:hypothetical protein